MKATLFSVLALAGSIPQAFAHYNFEKFIINGQETGAYEYIRRVMNSNSPVENVQSNDIRCNVGAFGNAAATKIHDVVAGVDTVGFTVNDNIGHPGPLFAYLSKSTTPDVRNYDGSGDWFKIYELGVKEFATYTTGMTWKSDGFKSFTFKLPAAIPNGQYLLRAEHIGVHGSGNIGGAQFYMSCAQINVIGGTGGTPSPVGKLPGLYSATDPGIYFQPYWPPVTNYTMPGPAVYNPGGSNPNPVTTTRTTTPAVQTTTSRTTTTPAVQTTSRTTTTTSRTTTTTSRTTTTATTTAGSGTGAALWAQCGGSGWTGPTTCAQGRCVSLNPYYSQCQN